jgi:hypothetical protein
MERVLTLHCFLPYFFPKKYYTRTVQRWKFRRNPSDLNVPSVYFEILLNIRLWRMVW